ncbi:hypothetical protein ZWY2020_028145 [Hordeum vulgare]|nr:hypothetical protein ZWY2020_028145 [Hordeum vulgare]
MASSPEGAAVVDAYKKALATAASVSAYAMLARNMARELLPDELCAAVRWGAAFVRSRVGARQKERRTIVIRRVLGGGYIEDGLFDAALTYLATKINPQTMNRLCLARTRKREHDGSDTCSTLLSMENGGSTTDSFQGVEFRWTSMESGGNDGNSRGKEFLELSFDAEHTETAIHKYVPFIMSAAEELRLRDRSLKIFLNQGSSWKGINHHHPATFDTLAMDPSMKQAVIADLDRFLKRKEYYRRIGKAWKRREDRKVSVRPTQTTRTTASTTTPEQEDTRRASTSSTTWSTCGEERVIVFTTNYKDRLDRALLQPGRMDMHVYMGHCSWEAFRTLARNYHLVEDHVLFPEIRGLLSMVEVTPAEVSEMLLRSEDVNVALQVLMEFLRGRRCKTNYVVNDKNGSIAG